MASIKQINWVKTSSSQDKGPHSAVWCRNVCKGQKDPSVIHVNFVNEQSWRTTQQIWIKPSPLTCSALKYSCFRGPAHQSLGWRLGTKNRRHLLRQRTRVLEKTIHKKKIKIKKQQNRIDLWTCTEN